MVTVYGYSIFLIQLNLGDAAPSRLTSDFTDEKNASASARSPNIQALRDILGKTFGNLPPN